MIIDGKALAEKTKRNIRLQVKKMPFQPGLGVILVGDDSASKVYVNAKEKACQEAGFYSKKIILSKNIKQRELLQEIENLNKDKKIHGILVQFPLPPELNEKQVIEAIDPRKDVDCFHPYNFGQLTILNKLENLEKTLAPCTAKGVIKLIEETGQKIEGKKAVVIGRSNLVGKPTALLLLLKNATVMICHSRTVNLTQELKTADILIAAVGRPKLITGEMIKKGAIVIDVGINRITEGLVGDVDFDKAEKKAGFITPVPGGAGPMTIACLLENTILLAEKFGKK